jgi:predicted nuclease of predicted toxin-antitoxin system
VRLLLDEMLSPVIAEQLRRHGHDAEAVKGRPLREGLSDREVMDLARLEHRAVVTNKLVDFRALHHEAIAPGGPGHCGMVFMPGDYRRTKADIGRIVTALRAKLDEYPGENDLVDGETWL